MKKWKNITVYHIIVYLIAFPAGLIFGLQVPAILDLIDNKKKLMAQDVQQAVGEVQQAFVAWNSFTSNVEDSNSYNSLYTSPDSNFVFMIAQAAQQYPLLDFRADTSLPALRHEQFMRFKDEMEKTRRSDNKRLKEFYLFRSIQMCADCEEDKKSVAALFPLDSLLQAKLQPRLEEVQLGFFSPTRQQYLYLSAQADSSLLQQSSFQYPFNEKEVLHLYFPKEQAVLWRSLWLPLAAAILPIILTLICFLWASRLLMKQHKLNCLKNDFINNVTHELKTPISTISFAVANIENATVIQEPERIRQFTKVIKEENKRLNQQVEKVLQAAISDKKAFELKKDKVNLHEIINYLADAYELKIKEKGGHIKRLLNAAKAEIQGDAFHLSNALSNLLDNAVKYSPEQIDIVLSTENTSEKLRILVADKGLGISRDKQALIFDKFYRVPTGDIHNIKGFGLGLSYVKAIAEQHQGHISLKSRFGKGSTFILELPLVEENKL